MIVNTAAALTAALKIAHGGDVIELAPGAYDPLALNNLHFDAAGVTITSLNPLQEARLTGFDLRSSSGLTFKDLEFYVDPAGQSAPFKVTNSQNITLDHLNIHGSLNNDSSDDQGAFMIRTSAQVSVTNSEFQQLYYGISHLDDDGLTVSNNIFHDIRMDGIRGGGSSNVTISNNQFRNFYGLGKVGSTGDHDDAIQFWTTNTTTSAHDITVKNNLFYRGDGTYSQGVFFNDEVGNLPYQHVTIANNTIIGGEYNGIYLLDGSDVTVTGNTVVGLADMKSWISIRNVSGVVITGNAANTYITTGDTGLTMTGNDTVAQATDRGAAAYQAWKAANPMADQLIGGDGSDSISGSDGIDYLRGGGGDDYIQGSAGFDDINGNQGNDTAHGGAGNDWVVGGQGNDVLFGDAGDDLMLGNLGNDTVDGGAGMDVLRGGQGDDVLVGGAGNDWLSGDRGNDTETGDLGVDTFHGFSGCGLDFVTDFHASEGDRIQLDSGTFYRVYQSGLNTVIDLGNNDQMVLANVQFGSLTPGWIFVG